MIERLGIGRVKVKCLTIVCDGRFIVSIAFIELPEIEVGSFHFGLAGKCIKKLLFCLASELGIISLLFKHVSKQVVCVSIIVIVTNGLYELLFRIGVAGIVY